MLYDDPPLIPAAFTVLVFIAAFTVIAIVVVSLWYLSWWLVGLI